MQVEKLGHRGLHLLVLADLFQQALAGVFDRGLARLEIGLVLGFLIGPMAAQQAALEGDDLAPESELGGPGSINGRCLVYGVGTNCFSNI